MLARSMRMAAVALAAGLLASAAAAQDKGPGDPTVADETDGKYFDANGNPTYKIDPDGTVDWYTYSGFRRYHSECHVCHGPDGLGSSYAPALVDSIKRLTYAQYLETVAAGKQEVNTAADKVMPSFGTNLNVMCYIDDIYVYLRARAQGDLPRGRPPKHAPKSATAKEDEDSCFGS